MRWLQQSLPGIVLWLIATTTSAQAGPLANLFPGQSACPAVPVPQAAGGYGANGSYTQASLSFKNPVTQGEKVYIYYPQGATPAPTIFFSHAFGARDPDRYSSTIAHLTSLGYTVVFSQYQTPGRADPKYDVLWGGFQAAVAQHPELIDTSRVAFFGHSFGGGASPRMALNAKAAGWGSAGTAMYIMAPWYSLRLSDGDLAGFDPSVKLVMTVYDEDSTNDHQMAIDVYDHIAIPNSEKAFIKVFSDTEAGCTLTADHTLPSKENQASNVNGLDYWNWYHMDALLAYTFTADGVAKDIALGGGSSAQTYWGSWYTGRAFTPAQVSTDPQPSMASCDYEFPCDSSDNLRAASCQTHQSCGGLLGGR